MSNHNCRFCSKIGILTNELVICITTRTYKHLVAFVYICNGCIARLEGKKLTRWHIRGNYEEVLTSLEQNDSNHYTFKYCGEEDMKWVLYVIKKFIKEPPY